MSPEIAVISAGHSSDRTNGSGLDHGHPNKGVVEEILSLSSMSLRTTNIVGEVFDGGNSSLTNLSSYPIRKVIDKEIYCTCWEHNIVIEADSDTGEYEVFTNR